MVSKPDSYFAQHMIRERNRASILGFLKEGPKRFTELQSLSHLSPRGLTAILKELENDKKIERQIHGKGMAYVITKKGNKSFSDLYNAGYQIEKIRREGGVYARDYSTTLGDMLFCHLRWGIQDDIAIDKEIGESLNPITQEIASDANRYLYKRIQEDVRNKKIVLDQSKRGKIILSLIIDYPDLCESLEDNSLEIRSKVSEKELDIFEIMDHGDITPDVMERFHKIMEKRKK